MLNSWMESDCSFLIHKALFFSLQGCQSSHWLSRDLVWGWWNDLPPQLDATSKQQQRYEIWQEQQSKEFSLDTKWIPQFYSVIIFSVQYMLTNCWWAICRKLDLSRKMHSFRQAKACSPVDDDHSYQRTDDWWQEGEARNCDVLQLHHG